MVTKIAAELNGFRFDIQRVLACGDVAVSQLRYAGTVKRTGRSLKRKQHPYGPFATGRWYAPRSTWTPGRSHMRTRPAANRVVACVETVEAEPVSRGEASHVERRFERTERGIRLLADPRTAV